MSEEVQDLSPDKDKYKAALQERDQLKASLAEYESKFSRLSTKLESGAQEWQSKYQELESRYHETVLSHEMEKTLLVDDIDIDDPDKVEFLKFKYRAVKAEEGKQRPSFSDWYSGYREQNESLIKSFKRVKEAPVQQPFAQAQQNPAPKINKNVVPQSPVNGSPNLKNMSKDEIIAHYEKLYGRKLKK